MANKVTSILNELRKAGYKPKFVEADDETVDDCIELSEEVSIQLCFDGALGLGHFDPDNEEEYVNYPYVDTVEEVLAQIKEYNVSI